MNNLEKEIQGKTSEEIYDFLWFLFHTYGASFTDSRQAIIEWIDGRREMNIHFNKVIDLGKWIPHQSKYGHEGEMVYTCDRCGYNVGFHKKNFCPYCGSYNGEINE